jgi:hypothetical protein
MKLYCPEGNLGPQPVMIDKDGTIRLVIAVEVSGGKRLPEWRHEARRRCEIRPRQRAFEPILRPKGRRRQSQHSYNDLESE